MPYQKTGKFLILFFLLSGFFFLKGYSQSHATDSLRVVLQKSESDTNRVNTYYQIGKTFETSKPDSAIIYFNKARALARELNFKKGQAAYASHAIVILNNQGKFREALELTKEALQLYQEIGSPRDLSVAFLNVGSEWHYLSDFQTASDNYLRALKIADAIDDKKLQRVVNNNLASIFINLQDYTKGKMYAAKSLLFAKAFKDDYAISSSMYNIATAELYLKQYDSALFHYHEIEAIGVRTDDYIVILDGKLGTADVYTARLDVAAAEKYYSQVIALSKEKDAPEYEMYAYMGISDVYLQTNRFSLAEKYVLEGIAIASELGSNFELKDLYLKASVLEEKTGDFSKALDFRKKFEVLNDSIIGEKSKSNINLLEARFESEKKAAMIHQLESDKKIQELTIHQKNNLNYILAGVVFSVLMISALAYRNYRQKQKIQQQRINDLEREKKLMATEAVLKGEEKERTRLAKDLHDGLGGMLSGIKYSLHTMKGNLIMTPENQQAFERSIEMLDSSIKEMRRVAHNMMPEALIRFGLDTALRDFCNDINQSRALKIAYQSIGLADVHIDQTISIAIYRIVQELINNTMKHAEGRTAIVQLTKTDNILLLTVEDDGKGFDVQTLNGVKGIGWTNIQSRVEFLKGKLDIASSAEGTSVHIEFSI